MNPVQQMWADFNTVPMHRIEYELLFYAGMLQMVYLFKDIRPEEVVPLINNIREAIDGIKVKV